MGVRVSSNLGRCIGWTEILERLSRHVPWGELKSEIKSYLTIWSLELLGWTEIRGLELLGWTEISAGELCTDRWIEIWRSNPLQKYTFSAYQARRKLKFSRPRFARPIPSLFPLQEQGELKSRLRFGGFGLMLSGLSISHALRGKWYWEDGWTKSVKWQRWRLP